MVRTARTLSSEGQALLAAMRQSCTQIGAMLGVSRQNVHHWQSGTKTPGPDAIQLMAERLGIPAELWGQRRSSAPSVETVPEVVEPAPLPVDAPAPVAPMGSTLAEVERNIAVLAQIRDSASASTPEKNKAIAQMHRYLALRSRLVGDARSDEAKLAASPAFCAMVAQLKAAAETLGPDAWPVLRSAFGSAVSG